MNDCVDLMDTATRHISGTRSLGDLTVTVEEVAPNQSAIIVSTGKYTSVQVFWLT